MNELIEEYGGVILGALAAIALIAVVVKLVLSGGILGELILKLGNMAC